jgi:hypothetical protein
MFFQTIVIVGVMLILLMIISTLGGSMNRREKFIEGDDDAEGAGITGEIISRMGPTSENRDREASGSGYGGDDTGADRSAGGGDPGDAGPPGDDYIGASASDEDDGEGGSGRLMVPETKGLPPSSEESSGGSPESDAPALEAFDGDMWAAY